MSKTVEAGLELAAAVAKEVMEYPVFIATTPDWRTQLQSKGIQCVRFVSHPIELRRYEGMKFAGEFRPDRDWAAAGEVLEKLRTLPHIVQMEFVANLEDRIEADEQVELPDWYPTGVWMALYLTPLAICLAALAAVRKQAKQES